MVLKNNYIYCVEEYQYYSGEGVKTYTNYDLLIYDITDKNNINEIYSLTTDLNLNKLIEYNNKLFLEYNNYNIAVYDLTLKNNPQKIGDLTFRLNDGINSLKIDSNYITISEGLDGTLGLDVFKYPYITNIKNYQSENPSIFRLCPNYPNPFNPSTTIKYSLPKAENITLKIYDILGRKVKTLVNEEKPAGNYSIEFNGKDMPSGVYFYQIRAGVFTETRKMLLLK